MRTGYFAGKLLLHGLLPVGKALKLNGLGGGFGAKLFGAGTSASPAINPTVGTNVLQFYVRHTGASGDNRLLYMRFFLQGGAGGECLRAFTTVNETAGTAHGAHLSLSFALTKHLTGQGVASRNTLHLPNDTSATGTLAATQSEIFLDGTSSTLGTAVVALHRLIVDGGDATARARVKLLMHLVNIPTGAGNMLETGIVAATMAAATTKALRINIDGVVHFLPIATAIA